MKTDHQQRVEEFMVKAGQQVPEVPTMPDFHTRRLRAALIFEEAMETIQALGFQPALSFKDMVFVVYPDRVQMIDHCIDPDFEGIVDGCADLSVVLTGTLSACGVQDGPILDEVDRSNLTKFRDGYSIREDGKLLKSSLYETAKYEQVERFLAGK